MGSTEVKDMEKITVYTSITGEKDDLKIDQNFSGDAKFVVFMDEPQLGFDSKNWEIRSPCSLFKDQRRNAKIHKVLSHQYIDSEYSIWMDGTHVLINPAEYFLKFLNGFDIAAFSHPDRNCIYDEADVCLKLGLDNSELINKQISKYRSFSFEEHAGLFDGSFIVRRHTKKVEEFNNSWWSEICTLSKRDQISLPYVSKKVGLLINNIPRQEFLYLGRSAHKKYEERV